MFATGLPFGAGGGGGGGGGGGDTGGGGGGGGGGGDTGGGGETGGGGGGEGVDVGVAGPASGGAITSPGPSPELPPPHAISVSTAMEAQTAFSDAGLSMSSPQDVPRTLCLSAEP